MTRLQQRKQRGTDKYFVSINICTISEPDKDPIPNDLKHFQVYKFTCGSCSSSYIGETCRHFKTRIKEHIKKDNKSFSSIYTLLQHALTHNSLCFKIIDKANSKFDLEIKVALHINWRKPNLNAQQNHLAFTLSL